MSTIFSQKEVNKGRQREFDYLKGSFMLFIFLIHAFQATFSAQSAVVSGIYIFGTMSGAAIFIFVMGFGTTYSKNAQPWTLAKDGIRMVVYQYLNNLLYLVSLLIPYPFVMATLSDVGRENLKFSIEIYFQYVNIFFITGIIYLVLALLKKLRLPTLGYLVLGIVISLVAPFLYGKPVDVPVLGYVATLLIGEAKYVSFTPLYFLSYALIGVAVGTLYRRIADKRRFYLRIMPLCLLVVIVWWALVFNKFGTDITAMRSAMGYGYTHPNLWHVVASLAHIFLFAAIFYFVQQRGEKRSGTPEPQNVVAKQILYYSKHISKYYALHISTYFIVLGLHGYMGFTSGQCWLLTLLSMIVTEVLVRGYNALLSRRKGR